MGGDDAQQTKVGLTPSQYLLAFFMLTTGSINTITSHIADKRKVKGPNGTDAHYFVHPLVQAWCMFIGEMLCLVGFWVLLWWRRRRAAAAASSASHTSELALLGHRGEEDDDDEEVKQYLEGKYSVLIFLPPAMCDMCGTFLLYLGLNYTFTSSFQMLRGALILFTTILSIVFLKRRYFVLHFIGCILVLGGLAVVGVANLKEKDSSSEAPNPMLGDAFVIVAQLFTAFQVVVEEKLFGKYRIPALVAVGWEGFWGFLMLTAIIPVMYFVPNPFPDTATSKHFEDFIDAFYQIFHDTPHHILLLAVLGNLVSIAFFNFCGVSVTKVLSATTRVVLDSARTLVVWVFSLAVKWESFTYLNLVGFFLIIIGTFVYNKILIPDTPWILRYCLGGPQTATSRKR